MYGWLEGLIGKYISARCIHLLLIFPVLTPSTASTSPTPTPATASASAETSKYCATNEKRPDRIFNFISWIDQSVFILIFVIPFLVIIVYLPYSINVFVIVFFVFVSVVNIFVPAV